MERIRNLIHGNYNPFEGFVPRPEDIQGWASTSPAFQKCITDIRPKLIIEVGSWKGCSAVFMAKNCFDAGYDDFEIVCIDTFLGSWEFFTTMPEYLPHEHKIHGRAHVYEQFLSNIIHTNLTNHITPFPIDSVNGALCLKHWKVQADMIYIDAGHDYDSVFADLILYKDLVRPGGYLLGDDWFHIPIKEAVADALGEVEELSSDKFLWVRPNEPSQQTD